MELAEKRNRQRRMRATCMIVSQHQAPSSQCKYSSIATPPGCLMIVPLAPPIPSSHHTSTHSPSSSVSADAALSASTPYGDPPHSSGVMWMKSRFCMSAGDGSWFIILCTTLRSSGYLPLQMIEAHHLGLLRLSKPFRIGTPQARGRLV